MSKVSISIAKDGKETADNSAQYANLDAQIVSAVETGRLPSTLAVQRYGAATVEDHKAELAAVRESKAIVAEEIVNLFLHLMALTGEPVVIDADRSPDYLTRLRSRAAARTPTQSDQGDEA